MTLEYCGNCSVCYEPVDLSELGSCTNCNNAFHWGECGEWHNGQHTCHNCMPDDEEE